ncbi:hypothetical protein [Actinocorallia longicatena]|uniref:LGFP repeat-containing protein n=1 Tax=Actinocorallia longicatena TaxID=111803 RepID=A0ABP6QH72_9ACTN
MHRVLSRALTVTTALVLAVSLGSASHADPPPLSAGVQSALKTVDPELRHARDEKRTLASDLDPSQKVVEDVVPFQGDGGVVFVRREVGAVRPVEGEVAAGGRVVATPKVKRAKAGTRKIRIIDTSRGRGPGLLIAAWTERTGVNYRIVTRGTLDRAELIKLVKALPADSAQPTRKALRGIRTAKPTRVAEPLRSTGNLVVDGSGDAWDDFGNEATLCTSCSYLRSDYAGMWQWILWAENKLEKSAIDCYFGAATATATKAWQTKFKPEAGAVDGVVGASTRNVADGFIDGSGTLVEYYSESVDRRVLFNRTSGIYHMGTSGIGVQVNYTGTPNIPEC